MHSNMPILINSREINHDVILKRLRGMVEKNKGFNNVSEYTSMLKCFENTLIHCQPASFGSHFVIENYNESNEFEKLLLNALSFVWQTYKLANKVDKIEHFHMKDLNNFIREYGFIFTEGTFGKDYRATYESSLRVQCTKSELVLTTLFLMCRDKTQLNPNDRFNKYMSWIIKIINSMINNQNLSSISKILGVVYLLEIVYNTCVQDNIFKKWQHWAKSPFMVDVVHGNDVRLDIEGIKSHLSYAPRLTNQDEKHLSKDMLFYNPVYCEHMVKIMTEDYHYLFKPKLLEMLNNKNKVWYENILTDISRLQFQTNYKFERLDSKLFNYSKLPEFTKEKIEEIKNEIKQIMPELNVKRVIIQLIIDNKPVFDLVNL